MNLSYSALFLTVKLFYLRRIAIAFSLYLFLNLTSFAQSGTLKGKITEAGSNAPIEFANVMLEGTQIGSVSDDQGNFEVAEVPPGTYNVRVSCVGFITKTVFEIEITRAKPQVIVVELEPSAKELKEVEVKASPFTKQSESPVSVRTVGANEIQRYPGGNRDISRVIQSLPGVGYTASFRNDILIRGGSPAENRFYMDGIEIPNINHFATQGASGGPVGLINVDFIREVNFYSGAFPAGRGNALSSIMDIRLREGRDDRFGFNLTMGSSEFALSVEGPLKKMKTQNAGATPKRRGIESATILASVRYSYLQGLFKLLKLPFLPSYLDAQYKIKIRFNPKNELILLGLGADDRFKLNLSANDTREQRYLLNILPQQNQWNYAIGAKYTHYFKESYLNVVVSRNMLGNHAYKYTGNDATKPKLYDYNSTEAENKVRLEVTGRAGAWKYNYGVNYEYARYTNRTIQQISYPGTTQLITIDYDSRLSVHKWGLFAQISRGFFRDRLQLSAGLRTDNNSYNKVMAFEIQEQLSPRFSASFSILPGWLINFNTGYYHQLPPYTALGFRDNNGKLVNRDRLTYIHNLHVVLGTEYQTKWNSRFSVEGFYKQYFNYPFLLRDSVSLANLGGDFGVVGNTELSSTNDGRSYGAEFLYEQKLFKGFYGIVAYTIFWSQFKDRNGDFLPSAWDSRHVISLTGGKKFKRNWEVGARWRVSGGQPYTPVDVERSSIVEVWNFYRSGLPDYSRLNSERNPWFHQLDIRVTKKWFFKKWSLEIYLDVQNLYAFKPTLAPNLDLKFDEANQPLYIEGSTPLRYQTEFLKNRNGQPIPTLGFVISY